MPAAGIPCRHILRPALDLPATVRLMLVAAPLIVMGRPVALALWALPRRLRLAACRWSRSRAVSRFWRALSAPFMAWLLYSAGFLRGRPAQRRAARPAAHHLASRCSAILVAAAIRSPRPYGIWHVGRVLIHHGPAYRAPWCVAHIRWPPFTIPRTRNARLHGDAGVGLFAAWLREAERYVQSATSIPQASRARGRSARFGGIGPE